MPFDVTSFITELKTNTENFSQTLLASPTQGKWQAADICEHIIIFEKLLLRRIPQLQDKAEAKNYGAEKLQRILIGMRNKKIVAPAMVEPKQRFATVLAADEAWQEHRAYFLELLQSDKIVVDDRTYEHPFLGVMTVEDWMYFTIQHTERHRMQIEELQA
ncbi:MAG: hypothetical protein RL660_3193 [Bacteroidota bacterium]|jgi:hypothetical protein